MTLLLFFSFLRFSTALLNLLRVPVGNSNNKYLETSGEHERQQRRHARAIAKESEGRLEEEEGQWRPGRPRAAETQAIQQIIIDCVIIKRFGQKDMKRMCRRLRDSRLVRDFSLFSSMPHRHHSFL